ncbi:MAG TPA: serine hydrolase domain-containing protein [Thermoanaerobaculia bacterium]
MSRLADWLEEEVAAGSFPGGAALVGSADAVLASAWAGRAAIEPAPDPLAEETLFDLASLTKPLATGALVRQALGRGLSLADPPGRFLPEWKRTRFEGVTVERLLTHTSGLPAWFPLYARGEGAAAYRRTLAGLSPERPPGTAVVYSDVGFLVLGEILEELQAAPLDRCYDALVAGPAKSSALFLPGSESSCAATERGDRYERAMTERLGLTYARFRDGVVRGEVHDGNAHRRGGVAAHAGLFGTATDVWRLARAWLDPAGSELTRDRTPELPEARGLAWQGARGAGSAVPEFPEDAFGHTGFTGTSIWIVPPRDRIFILLTNRIHPEVREVNFHEVRRRFHRIALALL